jgi:hypothetical protein
MWMTSIDVGDSESLFEEHAEGQERPTDSIYNGKGTGTKQLQKSQGNWSVMDNERDVGDSAATMAFIKMFDKAKARS